MLSTKKRSSFSIRLMMRRRTSPTPTDRTPGFLFKGIRLHALNASREFSDNFSVARRIVILATVFAMFAETSLKQVKIRLQSFASKPDCPWLPCVFKAAFLITDVPMFSKIAG